ncbi:hypothetical protein EF847_00090 [Actinobacteria bacterium YIM 96077]|uniref:Uncharacterized protein n=1 Tax=Phytoactinopolyspora halophila TaxID=1981511 RepID=A0A329QRB9_9ACTN|nr:hypothetical protein [Phytoactinopolyspora halophila]AYY11355.1 hypothetical protein EF847_00090 [Actinobacteria bacterium YIM 96077]RAW14696.1 hypothetical protein DPM12_10580 [Phytoactinopolyspora halophila]
MDERQKNRKILKHPITRILLRRAKGEPVYNDELDDLQLPDKQRKALDEAFKLADGVLGRTGDDRIRALNKVHKAAEAILGSLPDTYETRDETMHRRAGIGDPDAVAWVRAQREHVNSIADAVDGTGAGPVADGGASSAEAASAARGGE